ncbi:hypothetical protein, partial [Plesiomonas sp.]|uniref:hypothetical protein n=1 Tax=Plesiomonas sp. TaxID=2486279 RepID=UPI003F3169C6
FLHEAVQLCFERNIYNAKNIIEVASSKSRLDKSLTTESLPQTTVKSDTVYTEITPEKSQLQTYNNLFND